MSISLERYKIVESTLKSFTERMHEVGGTACSATEYVKKKTTEKINSKWHQFREWCIHFGGDDTKGVLILDTGKCCNLPVPGIRFFWIPLPA